MTKYYKDEFGQICRVYPVEVECYDPRKENDNVGHMMLIDDRLGDAYDGKYMTTLEGRIIMLLHDRLSDESIIEYAKSGESETGLHLVQVQDGWQIADREYTSEIYTQKELDEDKNAVADLADNILEGYCKHRDYWNLLQKADLVCLQLYMYEHGMITVRAGEDFPYTKDNDTFDGIIWTSKEDLEKIRPVKEGEDWKVVAKKLLKDEVWEYNRYLLNEYYALATDVYDSSTDEWEREWLEGGMFCDGTGEELLDALASEYLLPSVVSSLRDTKEEAEAKGCSCLAEFEITWSVTGKGTAYIPDFVKQEDIKKYILEHPDIIHVSRFTKIPRTEQINGDIQTKQFDKKA